LRKVADGFARVRKLALGLIRDIRHCDERWTPALARCTMAGLGICHRF